jgi:hypothetical protein
MATDTAAGAGGDHLAIQIQGEDTWAKDQGGLVPPAVVDGLC